MKILPNLLPPSVPGLPVHVLSEEEREAGYALRMNLDALRAHCREFVDSVALGQYSDLNAQAESDEHFKLGVTRGEESVWFNWTIIAARSAGLACRNFVFALEPVQTLSGRIAQWSHLIDKASIKEARRLFDSTFPSIQLVRHAIAHPENYANPKKNSYGPNNFEIVGDNGSSIFGLNNKECSMENILVDNSFVMTIDGKAVSFEFSGKSAQTLVEITTSVFAAFEGVVQNDQHWRTGWDSNPR